MIEKAMIVYHYLRTQSRPTLKTRQELEQWQEKRVRAHLRFVRKHSPFYREQWQGYDDADWRQFPIINKEIMMDHFDRLNTVGIRKDEAFSIAYEAERSRDFTPTIGSITIGLSSGTSGNRGIFLVSPQERRAWAGTVLAKLLPKSLLHKERIAFFLRANSNLYSSVSNSRIQFSYYDLLNPVEAHVRQLNEQRPGIVVAPPSMLRMLAAAKQSGHLQIEPHTVISVAEVLDKLDRKFIESHFGIRVHQVYQCTEGFLASTCPYGTLHVNEDIVVVEKEYLDKSLGRFIPIITDFSRRAQPIVRYRLNDVLTERLDPCPCGSSFLALEAIEGRCDDIFYGRSLDGSRLQPIFPDFISRAIINASEEIHEYLAIQHTPTELEIVLQLSDSAQDFATVEPPITQNVTELFATMRCKPPKLHFSELNDVHRQYSMSTRKQDIKKLRRVERRFQLATEEDQLI